MTGQPNSSPGSNQNWQPPAGPHAQPPAAPPRASEAQQPAGPLASPEPHAAQPPAATPQPAHPWGGPGIDIQGLTYRPVSPKLTTLRYITVAIWLGIPLLAGLALLAGGLVSDTAGITWTGGLLALVALGLVVWLLWLIPRQVRAMGYAETDDDLVIRKGILFRSVRVVPYGRMQFVDVDQGPFERMLGISSVKLHTASASSDAYLPGLPAAEAARLRDHLTARGEARLAGL